ncbi:uncharacterized protein BX663DRAFT_436565 [Cokeromyces recurvatus]|uniref:uncharacterized protein n=1 Tax=Cokeromyces recurvatus TaxID=90255 RepID=UPI00221EFCE4|nr:uncharacterized protein BX663DRAFT_436565 [Cokeromyces recurvatus]KAI7901984.1 hypothetical protein BX663DRAFT_436565 [Cokeromyces recurvatus]
MLNVHPIHSPEFKIHLDNDEVILRGTAEESAGVMLRGSVLFICHELTKVKSITLKFIGTTSVNWVEGLGTHQKHYKSERKIIEKEWTFLELKKKAYQLCSGRYKWDFAIPIPGNLPESIYHEMGQVQYKLKAYCDRPTFSMNYVDRRHIKIIRHMLPTSLDLSQSIIISNIWTDKIAYDISIPSKVYSLNKHIPISFDLLPIASHLKIKSVICSLKEYITFRTLDHHHKTEGRLINYIRDDQFIFNSDTGHWSKTELLPISTTQQQHVHYDMCGELIQVKHKLKFIVALQNADGHISELRAAIPVIIAPMIPEEDGNELPAYEDAWRSIPCDAETLTPLIHVPRTNSLPSIDSNSSLSSTLSNHQQQDDLLTPEPLPWMGFDISRVPSYGTALRSSVPCTLTPSLPNYESIVIV